MACVRSQFALCVGRVLSCVEHFKYVLYVPIVSLHRMLGFVMC